MAGFISIRKSIRWLPGEKSEPTSTLVLTSPQKRFVDLRILKDENDEIKGENLPISRLDWAIAGTSSYTNLEIAGQQVSRARFEHWIDSRTNTPENASDEGDMYTQSDGTVLEKGCMINPETGLNTPYEEVWDDREVSSLDMAQICVVLKYENGNGRGLVVKLGKFCQGFIKIGEQITLERWELNDEPTCIVRIGSDELPCKLAMERTFNKKEFSIDEEVIVADRSWTVVEFA